jgi:hypothetical protein
MEKLLNHYAELGTKLESGLSQTCLAEQAEVVWISVCRWQSPSETQSFNLGIHWWPYNSWMWVDCMLLWPIQLIIMWPLSSHSMWVDVWFSTECLLMITWPHSLLSGWVDVWFSLESVYSWSLGLILFPGGEWMCDSAQKMSAHDHLALFSSQTVSRCVIQPRECLLMIPWPHSLLRQWVDVWFSPESVCLWLLGLVLFSVGEWRCDSTQRVSAHDCLALFSSQWVSGCVIQPRECLLKIIWPHSLLSLWVAMWFSAESVLDTHDHLAFFSSQDVSGWFSWESLCSWSLAFNFFSVGVWVCDSAQKVSQCHLLASLPLSQCVDASLHN